LREILTCLLEAALRIDGDSFEFTAQRGDAHVKSVQYVLHSQLVGGALIVLKGSVLG
jgi:hypothetical protein